MTLMKKQIEPLSRPEIIKLDKLMTTIRYTVKRYNIALKLRAGYCKISLSDFDNENIFLEIESKTDNGVDIEIMKVDRKTMEPIRPKLIFNPENN